MGTDRQGSWGPGAVKSSSGRLAIDAFFDVESSTFTYVIHDRVTLDAAIIDPVLGFDAANGQTDTAPADTVVSHVRNKGLKPQWIVETHAHADHLSSAPYLKEKVGGCIAIGNSITGVQDTFARLFNMDSPLARNTGFDRFLRDQEVLEVGDLRVRALCVSGHTPADMAFLVEDAVFVGDTLFMPDVGTARADFPGGSARGLYRSIRRLLELPAETRMFVCHDYPPPTRQPACETTVAQQRAGNVHIRDGVTEDAFVAMRTARDRSLGLPRLFLPAIQVNVCAGVLPNPEANGVSYLKIPLNSAHAFAHRTTSDPV